MTYDILHVLPAQLLLTVQRYQANWQIVQSSVFNKRGQKMYALIGEISPLGLQFNFRELCSNYKNTKKNKWNMTKLRVLERYKRCRDINCEDLARRAAPQNAISNFPDRRREMYLLNSYLGALLFLPAANCRNYKCLRAEETEKRNKNKKKTHTRSQRSSKSRMKRSRFHDSERRLSAARPSDCNSAHPDAHRLREHVLQIKWLLTDFMHNHLSFTLKTGREPTQRFSYALLPCLIWSRLQHKEGYWRLMVLCGG